MHADPRGVWNWASRCPSRLETCDFAESWGASQRPLPHDFPNTALCFAGANASPPKDFGANPTAVTSSLRRSPRAIPNTTTRLNGTVPRSNWSPSSSQWSIFASIRAKSVHLAAPGGRIPQVDGISRQSTAFRQVRQWRCYLASVECPRPGSFGKSAAVESTTLSPHLRHHDEKIASMTL